MAETFMINQLMIKSKSLMKLEKNATGKGDNYTTGCLLDYQYFKNLYQLIAVDLSKQKEWDADRSFFYGSFIKIYHNLHNFSIIYIFC